MIWRSLDFALEHGAVDHGVADAGVEHGHQVQRLHDVRAVVAGQRNEGFEIEGAGQALICSMTSASTLGGWPPVCSRARISEVNSWPIGRPAKLMRGGLARAADGKGGAQRARRRFRAG
jgi:hypothetical protein